MAIVNYHCAKGRLIGEDTNGIRTDYITDALGSVTGTVNSSQVVVNTYRYKPFGELLAKTGTGADPKFMWNGSTQSPRTGIAYSDQYNWARHYGTRQGQWTTVDPLWPGESAYGYARQNPGTLVDPSGACPGQVTFIYHERICITGVGEFPGWWEATHPCKGDPCKYSLENDPTIRDNVSTTGWVSCCLGKAYACVRPGSFVDPSVKYCAIQHEEDHVRRNKNCKAIGNSGCHGDSPFDRELGGGYWDIGNNRDECLAYLVEHSCLDAAARKYGCSPSDAPSFNGHPNKQKCRDIFLGINHACNTSKIYCMPLGWRRAVCERWNIE